MLARDELCVLSVTSPNNINVKRWQQLHAISTRNAHNISEQRRRQRRVHAVVVVTRVINNIISRGSGAASASIIEKARGDDVTA